MNSFLTWLKMGGYAGYVWPAYLLVLAVFLLQIFSLSWQRRQITRKLLRWLQQTKQKRSQ